MRPWLPGARRRPQTSSPAAPAAPGAAAALQPAPGGSAGPGPIHQAQGGRSGRGGAAGKAPATPAPLSFASWFARRVRLDDAVLNTLDLLLMNVAYSTQILWGLACSGPTAAEAPELARLPARLGGLLARFPCAAGPAQRTSFIVTSGSLLDLRLRAALGDWGNAAHILGCVAMIALALCAPALHESFRPAACFLCSACVVAGWATSAHTSSAALLPFLGVGTLTAARRRIGLLYMGWKAVTVHRVSCARLSICGSMGHRMLCVTSLRP
jgi:hypothetical protein